MAEHPPAPDYGSILDDDALAPLKRNHACLQCKKRKVKCDAAKPSCSPCMRSHAHAVRAAQRSGSSIPVICCTYADIESEHETPSPSRETTTLIGGKDNAKEDHSRRETDKKKGGVKKTIPGKNATSIGKEREKRLEEERDTLRARIADLESKLSAQTPSTSSGHDSGYYSSNSNSKPSTSMDDYRLPSFGKGQEQSTNPLQNGTSTTNPPVQGSFSARLEEIPDPTWNANQHDSAGMDLDWDIGGLFVVPHKWPVNLPSPFLLEHLVETFFNCVPQLPRMVHKGNLLSRIRLPPTHERFPHASLLHAICAIASSHTAWVNSVPPEALAQMAEDAASSGKPLDETDDFGLAQAAAAKKAMDASAAHCAFGSGTVVFEMAQASILLADLFFLKGMPLQGWLLAGMAPRLIKSLELGNRNHPKRHKESMLRAAADPIEREERLATVWMAHVQDAGFSVNSYWSQSMDLSELKCPLPTSAEEFRRKDSNYMAENTQTAHSTDVLTEHPVADTFVLVVKASILLARAAKWLREWHQREIKEGDEMDGMKWPSYRELVTDVHAFQRSVPAATRNLFRLLDTAQTAFDANLLLVHVLPNIAFCLLQEPFVEWKNPSGGGVQHIQKSYEGVVGLLHLIPSNLDVSLVMTPLTAFSMYTVGRIIANFVQRALETQNYMLAVRYRADLTTVQNLLGRYGQKHALGNAMAEFLNSYLQSGVSNPSGDIRSNCDSFKRKAIDYKSKIDQPIPFEALDPGQQIQNILSGIGQQPEPVDSDILQAQLEGMFTTMGDASPLTDIMNSLDSGIGSSNAAAGLMNSGFTPGSNAASSSKGTPSEMHSTQQYPQSGSNQASDPLHSQFAFGMSNIPGQQSYSNSTQMSAPNWDASQSNPNFNMLGGNTNTAGLSHWSEANLLGPISSNASSTSMQGIQLDMSIDTMPFYDTSTFNLNARPSQFQPSVQSQTEPGWSAGNESRRSSSGFNGSGLPSGLASADRSPATSNMVSPTSATSGLSVGSGVGLGGHNNSNGKLNPTQEPVPPYPGLNIPQSLQGYDAQKGLQGVSNTIFMG